MNGDGRKQSIFLSVIGIATLLVAIVGATFAWFSTQVTGNEDANNITLTTAYLGSITFVDGDAINMTEIYPGTSETKTFTISAHAEATVTIGYTIYLDLDSTITNTLTGKSTNCGVANNEECFVYSLSGTSTSGTGTNPGTVADTKTNEAVPTTSSVIGTGTLGTLGSVHTYTFEINFREAGAAQNDAQGKTFKGKLRIDASAQYTAGGNVYTPTP